MCMALPTSHTDLAPLPLPPGISEKSLHCSSTGLTLHLLEAGNTPGHPKPLVLLCHGYPELAFSWRKVMLPLTQAGYHVVAFDQRGSGRTTGWPKSSFTDTDMSQFALTSHVRDVEALVATLGYQQVECIVGHDVGARTAGLSALIHPKLFKGLVMMSHPFRAPESHQDSKYRNDKDIETKLAELPDPKKLYKSYNSSIQAASDWDNSPQGLHKFLRGYLHVKSADWKQNKPHPLTAWTVEEVIKLPYYYVLPLDKTMPETVDHMMASEDESASERWMSNEHLNVYVQEWSRTGFQGGLNYYRAISDPLNPKNLEPFSARKIVCPSTYISGAQDWGNYDVPGALESLSKSHSDFRGVKLIDGAGHWPQ